MRVFHYSTVVTQLLLQLFMTKGVTSQTSCAGYDGVGSCSFWYIFGADGPFTGQCDTFWEGIFGCEEIDCFDCDQCQEMDFTSCDECTSQSGCTWCAEDAKCLSSTTTESTAFDFWKETDVREKTCEESDDYLSTCPANSDNVFDDPLYESQAWVYQLIKVEDVWKAGITGKGVHIRINDNGVDANHPDISANFDTSASCEIYDTFDNTIEHGTTCGSIAAASSSEHCSSGIAPKAGISSCRMLNDGNDTIPLTPEAGDYTFLSNHLDKQHVSSNSYGVTPCRFPSDSVRRHRMLQDDCPFLPDAPNSPCNAPACSNIDWSSLEQTSQCVQVVEFYCRTNYENDKAACIEYLDYFVSCYFNALQDNQQKELVKGITEGRGGKGIVYVFAAGNSNNAAADTNFAGTTNSRFIISVGSVGKRGKHSSYSTPGASLFMTGPGGDFEYYRNHIVAKPGGGCHDAGVGTSYACPVVSGVVALMLEENSELGWRDVQGIFASTSQKTDPDDPSWSTNAAGFHHSYKYGFGLVDAEAAVNAARDWNNLDDEISLVGESGIVDITITDDPTTTAVSTVEFVESDSNGHIVESVVVYVDLSHASRGDLTITLTSPSGTESTLTPGNRPENTQLPKEERWKLMTVRKWGETTTGVWTLSIVDEEEGFYSECVDYFDPIWYITITDDDGNLSNVTCPGLSSRVCKNGEYVWDGDKNILIGPDGLTPNEACCKCGGGTDALTVPNVLRSWRLAVYGSLAPATPTPTNKPSDQPTDSPTVSSTPGPTNLPTSSPTTPSPTNEPSDQPTDSPTLLLTPVPTNLPTSSPTTPEPTTEPVPLPTVAPVVDPTLEPTPLPTPDPTLSPTVTPVVDPTLAPTPLPTSDPTLSPMVTPVVDPTPTPTPIPTNEPSDQPTDSPTLLLTPDPTNLPTSSPTTLKPTTEPAPPPTVAPVVDPTPLPTASPTPDPTAAPVVDPTPPPIPAPTSLPTTATPVTQPTSAPMSPLPTMPTILLTDRQEVYSSSNPINVYFPTAGVYLEQKSNGNFVVYKGVPGVDFPLPFILWETGVTSEKDSYYTRLQGDGNLITRPGTDSSSKPRAPSIWKSGSGGDAGDYMFVLSADQTTVYIQKGTPEVPGSIVWSVSTNTQTTDPPIVPPIAMPTVAPVLPVTNKPTIAPISDAMPVVLMSDKENVLSTDEPYYYPDANVYVEQKKNGRFILYRGRSGDEGQSRTKLWQSGYQGNKGKYYTRLQGNGDLITRPGSPDDNSKQKKVWKTGSAGEGGAGYFLVVSGDQKTVFISKGVYDGEIVWSEPTYDA